MSKTATSSFGASRRESHDASAFYARDTGADTLPGDLSAVPPIAASAATPTSASAVNGHAPHESPHPDTWADRIVHASSTELTGIPEQSVALAFTSPPYNVGKEYEGDLSFEEYKSLIGKVAAETYRVLCSGGRYVVNVANLGRKPYIPLHAHFYHIHMQAGFLPMGEIIWRKGKGANGSCAWGSWRSARAPRLRDVHEYLLVFAKEEYRRPDKGESDIGRDEFMEATLSVWDILPESAARVGHPAPFPLALAERVVQLYSYVGDVVLDPFAGSGTTCVAAAMHGRRYVGFEIDAAYCELAERRIASALDEQRGASSRNGKESDERFGIQ